MFYKEISHKIEKDILHMRINSIIVDDFYSNPDEVRDFALSLDFDVDGNYPGHRTKPCLNDGTKQRIQNIVKPFGGDIVNWGSTYSGSFQYATAKDRSWIHSDSSSNWAGVLFLTPNAPLSAGTGLFRHKETGLRGWNKFEHTEEETQNAPHILEGYDYTKWDMVDRIGNIYNRLILYRSDNYHVSLDYFGKDKFDGRLFQVFFFTTEN